MNHAFAIAATVLASFGCGSPADKPPVTPIGNAPTGETPPETKLDTKPCTVRGIAHDLDIKNEPLVGATIVLAPSSKVEVNHDPTIAITDEHGAFTVSNAHPETLTMYYADQTAELKVAKCPTSTWFGMHTMLSNSNVQPLVMH